MNKQDKYFFDDLNLSESSFGKKFKHEFRVFR